MMVVPPPPQPPPVEQPVLLQPVAVHDLERDRDSLHRRWFLLASLDFERFLDLSLSLERERERLLFLLCLLLLECLERDELRLRDRPMLAF